MSVKVIDHVCHKLASKHLDKKYFQSTECIKKVSSQVDQYIYEKRKFSENVLVSVTEALLIQFITCKCVNYLVHWMVNQIKD